MAKKLVTMKVDEAEIEEIDAEARRRNLSRTQLFLMSVRRLTRPAARSSSADPRSCTHPINRRIGKQCAECGATVGK